ncbi:polysaccharide biosynthesis tyrosine autokinase [Frigoribacterium sp. VKM Ac-1396]|uniref:polysaccharide biosynthesis tyrosine autokinase n=1 Tax=Frigoribacterium sp. VKM Ac-1396 TaxID=2783821 RepID=UPI00188D4750|nr:polysaccharide biosynthesis tyrosine autokinase [Frigoribacterium sp. VKM Ac-1396]
MELRDYIRILRKGWIFIAALTLAGIAAGALASILATPTYVSSTRLFVSVQAQDSSTTGDAVQGSSAAQQKVRSYVDVVTSDAVLDPVIDQLGLDTTAAQLATGITAESPLNTVLINITVTDTDAQRAADVANAVGASLTDVVVNELETPADGGASLVKIATIVPGSVASAPATPRTALNLGVGLLIGLALGVGAAVLRSTLDTRIHGSHDVEMVTDAPIVGGISFDPGAKKHPLIVHVDPRNPRSESFRTLRTNLQFVNVESQSRCFVVTSSLPGEGKTTTTANLAVALAETGATVAVVDGDLRLPRLADTLGLEGVVGLTDVLIGRADLQDVLQPWGRGTMYVLPAGRVPPNPSELLGSKAMTALIESLTTSFDYVLIDAPPLLPVTDAAILSKVTGGAIVVSAAGRTTRNELQSALRNLEHIGSKVHGIVLTMLPTKGPDAYGYGNYSAYYGMEQDAPEAGVGDLPVAPKTSSRSGK